MAHGQPLTEQELNKLIAAAGLTRERKTELGRWLARNNGVAIYQNALPDSLLYGRYEFVSYGGRFAKINSPIPPQLMPGTRPGYKLIGYYPGFIKTA